VRGLNVTKVDLHSDGETLNFSYRARKFGKETEVSAKIEDLAAPKGDKFAFWSVYEFPDDLKTFT
jgi:hypothetical protein